MNITQVIISGIIMLLLDSVYLSIFKNFFNSIVNGIQNSKIKFKFLGAILCYILLIFGLNYFIIDQKKSFLDAFLLGIVIYGVYETTTYAIFDKWKLEAVVLDTLWGGILFATTYFLTLKILFAIKNA
jgi:uncharacterized membrane protein